MKPGWIAAALALTALGSLPFLGFADYTVHIAIVVLLWSFIYTGWSIMGRFGLVSLGHGAFMGIGAYTTALLWNYYNVAPWIGVPIGVALAVIVALVIGYPCSRFKVVGHYFALVTLALAEVVRLSIVAARDATGGSLGMTPKAVGGIWAFQFTDKAVWYGIAVLVWVVGLWIWRTMDRSESRKAMDAISEDETAAAAVGVNVTLEKLRVTVISAGMTSFGGALYAWYHGYLNPDTVSGIGVSLQIVFAAIAGGMYSLLGPTVGAIITIVLQEGLRILFGTQFVGAANTIYGIMLIVFIIFMPRGVVGLIEDRLRRRPPARTPQPLPAE